MRDRLRWLPLVAVLLTAAAPAAAAQDFRWSGSLPQGKAVEIRGINGDVVAGPSGGNTIEVTAQKTAHRDDPSSVQIEVVQSESGVTICAVYPNRENSRPNECEAGGGHTNVQNSDVRVNFTVKVPAGIQFSGNTVNGDVEAERLSGDLALHTVNGGITFSTTGHAQASTVNGSIRGEIGRADWSDSLALKTVNGSVTVTLPSSLNADFKASTVNGDIQTDFPLTLSGRVSRRRLEGTIGNGGRELTISTVNGGITLKRG
jgi:hypothetical protein